MLIENGNDKDFEIFNQHEPISKKEKKGLFIFLNNICHPIISFSLNTKNPHIVFTERQVYYRYMTYHEEGIIVLVWLIDVMIDFYGTPTSLGLLYAKMVEKRV